MCVCIFAFLLLIQAVGCGDGWKSFQEQDILSQGHIYNKCSDRIICVTSSPFRKLWRTHQRTDRLLVNYTSNNISWKEGIWILRMIWILWNYVFFFSELFCPAYWHWEKRKRKLPHGSDQFSRIKQKKYLHNGILCI